MARVVGQKEVVQGWLYDSFVFTAGTTYTSAAFFQIPLGQQGKTYYDTNMKTAGMLAGVNALTVKSLVFKVQDGIPQEDMAGVLASYGGLLINEKVYPDFMPMWAIQGGASYRIEGQTAGVPIALGGDASISNVLSFTRPFLFRIAPNEPFRWEINFPVGFTPASTFRAWIFMFGRMERAVA